MGDIVEKGDVGERCEREQECKRKILVKMIWQLPSLDQAQDERVGNWYEKKKKRIEEQTRQGLILQRNDAVLAPHSGTVFHPCRRRWSLRSL